MKKELGQDEKQLGQEEKDADVAARVRIDEG